MCGRYTNSQTPEDVFSQTQLMPPPTWCPSYNVAPSERVLALRTTERGVRELALLRWGLLPSWANDATIANQLAMARAETLAQKPAFREAVAKRRCALVADGFFEWLRRGGISTPLYFRFARPLFIAGLWERWRKYGHDVESCCVVTTSANAIVGQVHDRMPVLLDEHGLVTWLAQETSADELHALATTPAPASWLRVFNASPAVNNPRNDYAALLGEYAEEARAFGHDEGARR